MNLGRYGPKSRRTAQHIQTKDLALIRENHIRTFAATRLTVKCYRGHTEGDWDSDGVVGGQEFQFWARGISAW